MEDTAIVYSSGIVKKGEDIIEFVQSSMKDENKSITKGHILLTNKRLLFLEKTSFFSKGLGVVFYCSLGVIVSVSPGGLMRKKITLTYEEEGELIQINFSCKNHELFTQKLVGAKEEYVEAKTMEAKKIVIEESGKKETADEILKKKLARGEITLDEFHEKIQRT